MLLIHNLSEVAKATRACPSQGSGGDRYLARRMRLPSLATLVKALTVLTLILIVAIALGGAYLIGNLLWAIPIGLVLALLMIPPIFVGQNLIQRMGRMRRARAFRQRTSGQSRPPAASDRETMA